MSVPLTFIPTRAAALARLAEFLPVAGRYAADRNFVRPGIIHGVRPYPDVVVTRSAHLECF